MMQLFAPSVLSTTKLLKPSTEPFFQNTFPEYNADNIFPGLISVNSLVNPNQKKI